MAKPKSKPEAAEPKDDKPALENWADKPDSDIYEKCEKVYPQLVQAYKNREEADLGIKQYWDIYNAQPDDNQMYVGNSKCYLPVVRDAVTARAKRSLKQLFPNKYKHVEAIGSDPQVPTAKLALLEHYIRGCKLRSVVRSMLIAGDVTGQWGCYVDWRSTTRNVTGIVKRNSMVHTADGQEVELEDGGEVMETEDEEVTTQGVDVCDFAVQDLVVIPPTCNDINLSDASCLKLRMSKEQIKVKMDEGLFIIDEGSSLGDWVSEHKGADKQDKSPEKARLSDAGIKTEGTFKYALIFWAQMVLTYEKGKGDTPDKKCLFDVYYAGENEIIGIVKAPQWGQKRSIISAPVERIEGSFYGISRVEAVKSLQWNLNDFWNMGQDSASYSLLPIVMTDPEKNPNYAMMVYGLAAVWPVNPDSTKMTNFPALWKDAAGMCQTIKAQIHESLDVNEMMMGAMPKGRKNNATMGAQQQEQSVSVTDNSERFEEEILNPMMEMFAEYDAQFRDDELSVLSQGEIGIKASIMVVPVQAWGERYFYQWSGTSFLKNLAMMQQQIALMNVLRGIPPDQLNGRRLDICPILEVLVENVFGVELGGKILIDDRNKYSVPAEVEDEMLLNGIMVDVHEADDDMQHMQVHQAAAQGSADPTGLLRTHMQNHAKQLEKKRQMAAPQPKGQPGMPGGAGPGVPGAPVPGQPPRMGAQPAPQRPVQGPPGAIPPQSGG